MESLVHSLFLDILSTLVFRGRISTSELEDEDLAFLHHFCEWRHALNAALKSVQRKTNIVFKLYLNQNVLSRIPHTVLCRFPFRQQLEKVWYEEEIPLPQDKSTIRKIKMLNLYGKPKKSKDQPPIISVPDFISELDENGFRLFFHGTSHSSAKDIIERGIRLDKLDKSRRQDFSCGKGFYLTDRYDGQRGAVSWAFERFSFKQAVLIFKTPEKEINKHQEQSKNFLDDKNGLIEFVRFCRDMKLDKESKKQVKKMLKDLSYVEGPWVTVNRQSVSPISDSYQICLLEEELAKCFERNYEVNEETNEAQGRVLSLARSLLKQKHVYFKYL